MNILLVATLKRKVTVAETASRSQIIYHLAKGLAEDGHVVSLLGTADSDIPGVTTIPILEKGWVDLPPTENPWFREIASLMTVTRQVVDLQDHFDIIHNHLFPEFVTPIIERELRIPLLTTIHSQAVNYLDDLFAQYTRSSFVAISEAHRKLFNKAKIVFVVHNGIDTSLYSFQAKKQDYLLWIGRITGVKNPQGRFMDPKGVRHAIALAKATGQKLLLSGSVHSEEAFAMDVKPFLNDMIQWVGEVSKEQPLSKAAIVKLMQDAKALLMTINWEEPFGLVMAEAMSCGTPVIGFNRGSVSELVVNEKTGFVVAPQSGIAGLKNAVERLAMIDPQLCHEHVEKNFSIKTMVGNYEKTYQELVGEKHV